MTFNETLSCIQKIVNFYEDIGVTNNMLRQLNLALSNLRFNENFYQNTNKREFILDLIKKGQ